nr:MAG TPA: hypothetical protein [Siphovirus LN-2020-2]
MITPIYDGSKSAGDILIDYTQNLRDKVEILTDDEINGLIGKLQTCADKSQGDNRRAIQNILNICRTELDDRDLVRCLVDAGLIVGINSIEGVSDE